MSKQQFNLNHGVSDPDYMAMVRHACSNRFSSVRTAQIELEIQASALEIKLAGQRKVHKREADKARKQERRERQEQNRLKRATRLLKGKNVFCFYCDIRLTVLNYTIDHFIPISRGGTNYPPNKVPACRKCNEEKGNQLGWKKGCRIK